MSDIYFIIPPSTRPGKHLSSLPHLPSNVPSVGVAYLSAILKENGFSMASYDLTFEDACLEVLKEQLLKERPKLVGLSCVSETYSNALRLAKACKELDSKVKIVIGGPHVSFTASKTLEDEDIDIVVRFEAEETILEIANYYLYGKGDLGKIKGISFRKDEKVIHNPQRPFLKDLDTLPFPDRELFKGSKGKGVFKAGLITSRGCPHKCIFCVAPAMGVRHYRKRSPENILEELLLLKEIGIKEVAFLDDIITVDHFRMVSIIELMKANNLNLSWSAECRVDVVTPGLLKKMAKAGCIKLQFGVESGSQEILNKIQKGITLEQIEDAVSWAKEADILVFCSLMLGHPFDTLTTMRQTISFAERLHSKYGCLASFAITTPFPGTYMYEHVEELGIKNLSLDYDYYDLNTPLFDTANFTKQDVRNLLFEVIPVITQHFRERLGYLNA